MRVSPVQHGLTFKLSSAQETITSQHLLFLEPIGGQYLASIGPATAKKLADSDARDVDFAVGRSLLRQMINLDQTDARAAILAAHNRRVVTSWKGDKNR